MIQTGIKPKEIFDFLKDNLNIIIIVPAFLGGLWQLFELMNISVAFIRFFSITQIVSDGLFILYILIYFSIPIFGAHFFHTTILKTDKGTIELLTTPKIKNKKTKLLVYTISFFALWLFGVIVFWYFTFVSKGSTTKEGFLLFPFVIIGCNHFLNVAYKTARYESKHNYKLCNFFLLILYTLMIIFFFKKLHRNQLSTIPIINVENVKNVINKKYPNTKTEIIYFNDKYIFVKIGDKEKITKQKQVHKEKIYIMKTESLFND